MTENQVSSPVKETPNDWEDDKRMNVLFSPFRKREQNPIHYDSKVKFWNNIIMQWCLENNRCIVTLNGLKSTFKRKGKTPACLMTVLQELIKSGDLKNKSDFCNTSSPDSTWTSWAMSSVKSSVVWSFYKLKEALYEIDLEESPFVYLGYLKKKSEEILSLVEQQSEKTLYTIEEMQHLIEPPECSLETAELLLHWLIIDGKAASFMCGDTKIIKFASNIDRLKITEREIAQFKLQKSKEALMHSIHALEKEKEKALFEAREHLSKEMKVAAKSSLRKKKALEECINKRISTMDNLDLLLTRIKDSQSDAVVYDSYKIGLSALKATFKEAGLTEDNVMDTMSDMEEINEMHDEIQNAIAHQLQPSDDDDELERELSAIFGSEKSEEELILPDVPSYQIEEDHPKMKKVEPIKFAPIGL